MKAVRFLTIFAVHKQFKDQEQVPWYHFSCILILCHETKAFDPESSIPELKFFEHDFTDYQENPPPVESDPNIILEKASNSIEKQEFAVIKKDSSGAQLPNTILGTFFDNVPPTPMQLRPTRTGKSNTAARIKRNTFSSLSSIEDKPLKTNFQRIEKLNPEKAKKILRPKRYIDDSVNLLNPKLQNMYEVESGKLKTRDKFSVVTATDDMNSISSKLNELRSKKENALLSRNSILLDKNSSFPTLEMVEISNPEKENHNFRALKEPDRHNLSWTKDNLIFFNISKKGSYETSLKNKEHEMTRKNYTSGKDLNFSSLEILKLLSKIGNSPVKLNKFMNSTLSRSLIAHMKKERNPIFNINENIPEKAKHLVKRQVMLVETPLLEEDLPELVLRRSQPIKYTPNQIKKHTMQMNEIMEFMKPNYEATKYIHEEVQRIKHTGLIEDKFRLLVRYLETEHYEKLKESVLNCFYAKQETIKGSKHIWKNRMTNNLVIGSLYDPY